MKGTKTLFIHVFQEVGTILEATQAEENSTMELKKMDSNPAGNRDCKAQLVLLFCRTQSSFCAT